MNKDINENLYLLKLLHKTHDNIRSSDQLRCEINLEENLMIMLDKALLCISYMTGDVVFYKENLKKIKKNL